MTAGKKNNSTSSDASPLIDVSPLIPPTTRAEILANAVPFYPRTLLPEYTKLFPKELTLFHALGIHPDSGVRTFFDPYQKRDVQDNFSNVGEHSLAVAFVARTLAQRLQLAGKLSAQQVDETTRRALLHDATKPYCAFLGRARKAGIVNDGPYYALDIFQIVKDILVRQGVDATTARDLIDDLGRETNNRSFFQEHLEIPVTERPRLQAGRWQTKLVHLADDMTCSPNPEDSLDGPTYVVRTWFRLILTNSDTRYPWGRTAGLAVSPEGQLSHQEFAATPPAPLRPLGNYHHLMVWACREMSQELAQDLGLAVGECPEQVIEAILNESLS